MKVSELFLREQNAPATPHQARVSSGTLSIELDLEVNPGANLQRKVEKNIKFVFPKAKVIFDSTGSISTIFEDIRESHLHEIDDLYNNVIQTVEETISSSTGNDYDEIIAHGQVYLIFEGVPSFPINHGGMQVTIKCADDTYGLSGLDKIIGPKVEALLISNFQKLKGNILSLAKVKCDELFLESDRAGDLLHRKIEAILEKYRPSQDIVGFQEELIDNGLKDFAEL